MIVFSHLREEKGKKEIKALQKQLHDAKKQTGQDLQVRALSTGHLARGKPVRKLASAAQHSGSPWPYTVSHHLGVQKQNNYNKDLYLE